jgi:hypothetical protein
MTENDNELNELIGKVLRIDTEGYAVPLYGRLLEVKPYWILIERKSGAKRMVSRARITGIEENAHDSR